MINKNKYLLSKLLKILILSSTFYQIKLTTPSHGASPTLFDWGAGKGGNAGLPQPGGHFEGYDPMEGNGGDGGGENGGEGGELKQHIQTAATISDLLIGQNGGLGDIGTSGSQGGGGGGGGGTALAITDPHQQRFNVTINSFIQGGAGGKGGNGDFTNQLDGMGGGGGDGGSGIYAENTTIYNNGVILGGDGGNGGDSSGEDKTAGKGGDGGQGVILALNSNLFNQGGKIIGGNGGSAGNIYNDVFPAVKSQGGAGLVMLGESSFFNLYDGTIKGGKNANISGGAAAIEAFEDNNRIKNNAKILSADESDEGIAINIWGSNNYLTLLEESWIKGKVISHGEGNTFALSGSYVGSFNVSQIGDGAQYQGFENFLKAGKGKWKLLGDTNALTPWVIKQGTLSIESDFSLGSRNGSLTLDGGTLELRSWDEESDEANLPLIINRQIILTENDGIIDTDTSDGIILSEIQGEGGLQKSGKRRLILSANNNYTGNTYIEEGSLQIGNGKSDGTIKGDIRINEDASLVFDHSGQVVIENNLFGNGDVFFNSTTHTAFVTNSPEFEGTTAIERGTLAFIGVLGGTTYVKSEASLTAAGFIEDLENSGKVLVGTPLQFGTLSVAGDYTGIDGSNLSIKVALGDDNSAKDYFSVMGDSNGRSTVKIINIAGTGGDTIKGIEVISVGGDSSATFNLMGDYNLPSGTPAVVAGAHSYVLEKGTATDPTDGNWYLRSHFAHDTPPNEDPDIYQPGVPLYSSYAHIVDRLNTLPTMRERVGNRYWKGSAAEKISQGDEPGGNTEPAPDPAIREVLTDAGLIWARVEAAHNRTQLHNSTTKNKYNSDQWSLRAGVDNQILENAHGKVIAGIWLQYDTAKADISSYFGSGNVNAHSYGVGAALTWLSDDGFYIDGQGRYSWSKSDISSETLNRTLITDAKGNGLALSLEAGQQIAINERWSWTPQGQLTWTQTSLDDFTDPYNAAVSFETLQSFIARIGMSAQYSGTWQNKNGYTTRTNAYSITNIYREFLDRSPKMNISDELIYIGNEERTWVELGFGGTYAFLDDKYALFGEAAVASPFKQLGDNYSLRGNVGFRANW